MMRLILLVVAMTACAAASPFPKTKPKNVDWAHYNCAKSGGHVDEVIKNGKTTKFCCVNEKCTPVK